MRIRSLASAAVVFAVLSATRAGAQDIDTRNPNPGTVFHQFGGDSTYWVQTFTTPTGAATLTDFSVWLTGGADAMFHARVFKMFGDEAQVFDQVVFGTGGAGPQEIAFSFTPIGVSSNAMYALYLNGASQPFEIEAQAGDTYAGGSGYWSLNGSALDHDFGHDLDFTAQFEGNFEENAAPEPASLVLIATGLSALGVARRRKKA